MDVPDNLLCVFSARVEEQRDSYVIEVPKHEVTNGEIQRGGVYRTALLASGTETGAEDRSQATRTNSEAGSETGTRSKTGARSKAGGRSETETSSGTGARSETNARRDRDTSGPPVEEGEVRDVEIEDIGDKGDGIARVERGYVIIVPGTDEGDRVTIEITNVRENVAFSEVVESEGDLQ